MKIVVNMTCLEPPLTGIGHYTKELLKEMLKDERIEDIQGFVRGVWVYRDQIEQIISDGRVKSAEALHSKNKLKTTVRNIVKKVPFSRRAFNAYIRIKHNRKFKSVKDYIYWEPNFTPIFENKSCFVTVYDLSYVRYAHLHPKERVSSIHKSVDKAIKDGAKIITISEFSKDEISAVYGVEKSGIFVVPPGTADRFFCRDKDEIKGIKEKYGIEGDYILSVCTVEPRKNLVSICKAYFRLDSEIKKKYRLILAGKSGWLNEELEKVIVPMERDGFVKRIGYVDDGDLPALYSGASLFTYLSLYEGYGMPIAEAIRCGTPTLTSDIEPMKSVGGDKAHLANPLDVEDIKSKMIEALSGAKPQTKDKTPYIFEWSESAKKMVDIFEIEWAQKS